MRPLRRPSRPAVALALCAVMLLPACTANPARTVAPVAGGPATGVYVPPAGTGGPGVPGPSGSPTTGPSSTPKPAAPCPILPADDVWHADISHLPVNARSAAYVNSIGIDSPVHADFGSGLYQGAPIGIPITTVRADQPKVRVTFQYASESDRVGYPVPRDAAIEGGASSKGDRHILLFDPAHCVDYELYAAYPTSGGNWRAGSGAVYDLRSDRLRPSGWTSADAAGLPILPGLVTWADIRSGHIDHAIRVTVPRTRSAFIWPARHQASDSADTSLPPMGLRLRLKAGVDISHLPTQARIVAEAMKKYGIIVADNGSPWFISGAPDPHFSNDQLHALGGLTGADFEAVDESGLMVSAGSGACRN